MSIIFYDHLVSKIEIVEHIDSLPDSDSQKGKAKQLVDDIIHQGVMEYILSKLYSSKHKTFLEQVHHQPYDPEIISFLKDHVSPEIEAELTKVVDKLITDVKKDLLINDKK